MRGGIAGGPFHGRFERLRYRTAPQAMAMEQQRSCRRAPNVPCSGIVGLCFFGRTAEDLKLDSFQPCADTWP